MSRNFVHGKDTYFSIDGHDISEDCNKVDNQRSKDTADTLAFTVADKEHVNGQKSGTINFDGLFDAATDAFLQDAYDSDTSVPYVYGPAGNATGMVKYSGNLTITQYTVSGDVGGYVKATCSGLRNGPETRGVF